MYDTVAQYQQVLSGEVDDWHPPIMARLWQSLHPVAAGTAPMFALQVALYALGLGLIVGALARDGRRVAAGTTALLALSPLLLGWQMVVLKDAQMSGALIAAVGIVAHYRLSVRKLPVAAAAAVALLIAYATLVRANGVFATIPLAVLLLPTRNRPLVSAALAVAGIGLVLAITPVIDHRVLGAEATNVAKTLPVYDLAAIAMASPQSEASIFSAKERAEIADRHCVKAFFWDPLGDEEACGNTTERLMEMKAGTLYRELARGAAAHPVAYAGHRLRHWNSTERWLVSPALPEAAPPIEAEPNTVGLATPKSAVAAVWQDAAAVEAGTPVGWPIVWLSVALLLVPVAWRVRDQAEGSLALALLVSAMALEGSFLLISIASDLRYHLWAMTASALGLVLLMRDLRAAPRWALGSSILISLVITGGLLSRWTLPQAPFDYQAMIHAPSG